MARPKPRLALLVALCAEACAAVGTVPFRRASREPVLVEPLPVEAVSATPSIAEVARNEPAPARELEPFEVALAGALSRAEPRFAGVEAAVRATHWDEGRDRLAFFAGSELERTRLDLHLGVTSLAAVLASLSGASGLAHELRRDVLGAWTDPAAVRARIVAEATGTPQTELARRLALAADAVSEALFASAEEQRNALERLTAPAIRGSRSPDAVRRFTRDRLSTWFEKKRASLDATKLAYARIAEIEPDPSPRWLVAAAERTGTMLALHADELDASIAPLESTPEDTAAFRALVRATSERTRSDGQDAFRTCVSYAERYRIDDADVRRCRSRLRPDP